MSSTGPKPFESPHRRRAASLLTLVALATGTLATVAAPAHAGAPLQCTTTSFASSGHYNGNLGTLSAVALADLNGDERADYIGVGPLDGSSNLVELALGDSGGGLSYLRDFYVGFSSRAVAAGDFNGDAKPDLALAVEGSAGVKLFYGMDVGTFRDGPSFSSLPAEPTSLAAGHLNQDGHLDLVVTGQSGAVSALLSDSTGILQAPAPVTMNGGPALTGVESIATGDFDGDAKTDLAFGSAGGQVAVYSGDGGNTFTLVPGLTAAGLHSGLLTAADFNGDGRTDLAGVGANWHAVILTADASGTFDLKDTGIFALGMGDLASIAAGDIDGDRKADLVIGDDVVSGARIIENTCEGLAFPLTSSGVGDALQEVTVTTDGSVTLLDNGTPTTTLTVGGQGAYTLDPATGKITFKPVLGFSGTASGVTYRVTAADGRSGTAAYTPTVTKPAHSAPGFVQSDGKGTAAQSVTLPVPPGGSVRLQGETAPGTVTVDGQGVFTLDPATGKITFTPALGFVGQAVVEYAVTDAYTQTATGDYAATVTTPDPPVTEHFVSTGQGAAVQKVTATVPAGGRITLLDAGGHEVETITVASQGGYVLDAATGVISFTPASGFSGMATAVSYRVTDAYGQSTTATYQSTVTAAPARPVTPPKPVAPPKPAVPVSAKVTAKGSTVAVPCTVSTGRISECAVTLRAATGSKQVLGTGRVRLDAKKAAQKVTVPVTLNATGKKLVDRIGGVTVRAQAVIRPQGATATVTATAATRLTPATAPLQVRAIRFASGSTKVTAADARYLTQLRRSLGDVRVVRCEGYTDNRDTAKANRAVAQKRAAAVCKALTKGTGVNSAVVSYGEKRPVASNATAAGRANNRRVQITFVF
ncbi:FG-GAP-like repeat-containing protein [Planomonospora corallina]|uniref:FG-GAP-like repeat-containing protein n=1 Tax=Planomonospora corallina TaxID=1806052 RepID=A0ABV8IJX0_9ACTN